MKPTDLTVDGNGTTLAVRDFGGPGDAPTLLLVHGFGGNLLDWSDLAPRLVDRFRIVALDLRGNGASGDGPYDLPLVLDDLEAVRTELDLGDPYVVGMSYGGWIAVAWAERHPDCPGIVSLDGIRIPLTEPRNYVGLDPEELARQRAALAEVFDAQAAAAAAPVTPEQVEAMIAQRRRIGFPDDIADSGLRRNLTTVDGRLYSRPRPDVMAAMHAHLDRDLVPAVERLRCPALIVVATQDLLGLGSALTTAYRRGLDRDLDALVAARPDVRVVRLDATHGMVFEKPDEVAALIADFVGGFADPRGLVG
ncbi:MAG TPA: alpha/beta hydrolase [Actinopolymorphaceae bacterium]